MSTSPPTYNHDPAASEMLQRIFADVGQSLSNADPVVTLSIAFEGETIPEQGHVTNVKVAQSTSNASYGRTRVTEDMVSCL